MKHIQLFLLNINITIYKGTKQEKVRIDKPIITLSLGL